MRSIQKRAEPRSLTEHRCSPFATYDNYKDMGGLREALVGEQRGLCCYCLGRIRPDRFAMKIEHWRSQSEFPQNQLDYGNLLAACLGEGPNRARHCDTAKGAQSLTRNPANPSHRVEDLIEYARADGKVYSRDPLFNDELNRVLNLNAAHLRNRRKELLLAFLDGLEKINAKESHLRKELAFYSGESHAGPLEPYCMIIVNRLRKKLNRG